MQNNPYQKIEEPTPTQLYHSGGRKERESMLLKGGYYSIDGKLLKLAKYSWTTNGFKIYCTDLLNKTGEYRYNHGLLVKSLDELIPCTAQEQMILSSCDKVLGYSKWVNYCDERDSKGKVKKVMSKASIEGMMALAETKEKDKTVVVVKNNPELLDKLKDGFKKLRDEGIKFK